MSEEFQKTVLNSFTEIKSDISDLKSYVATKDELGRIEERSIKLFEKLNDKIDLTYEEMKKGHQMLANAIAETMRAVNRNTDAINRINERLDKSDKIEIRLDQLENKLKKLEEKIITG